MTTEFVVRTAAEQLSGLSPPFHAFDDAARYVLGQIDRTQGRSFGGYLFHDPNGECRATYPQEGALDDFLLQGGVPKEEDGNKLLPQGYRYVAYYFCDIDRHAQIKQQRDAWSDQRIALTQSIPSFKAVSEAYNEFPAFYTVGPEGSLVRFVPDVRALQSRFFPKMRARAGTQPMALVPANEPVEHYINELLAVGELSVVVSSPVWAGWRGELTASWRPYQPDPDPDRIAIDPEMSPTYGAITQATTFVHEQMLRTPSERKMGFVFRARNRSAFFATVPVGRALPDFEPTRVFVSDTPESLAVPQHADIVGAYSLCIDAPAPPTVKEPWLYERFISPLELANGINTVRTWVRGTARFTFYLSTFDGAQLTLTFPDAKAEADFFNPEPTLQKSIDNNIQAALLQGTLTPSMFIRKVAAAAELTVLKTSAVWDVPGRVDAAWKPFARHTLPTLSPVFVLADDAARYAHEQIGSRRDEEYIGLILRRDDHRFVATEPVVNPAERFNVRNAFVIDRQGQPIALPKRYELHGVYSSKRRAGSEEMSWQGEEAEVAAQMFMDTDVHTLFKRLPGIPVVYLSGSADSLLAYQPFLPGMAHDLLARVEPGEGGSPIHRELKDGALVPSDVVREMLLGGVLRVVVGNRTWGAPGKVATDWSGPFDPQAFKVPDQPALGPIFANAPEALAHACARWRTRYAIDASGLGFVLKHRTKAQFVTTQTVPGEQLDRLHQVSEFGAQVLIDEFRLYGVYYSSRRMAPGLLGQDAWLARHFIDAQSLYHALYDQQHVRRGGLTEPLALYCSTLDGALLEYRTSLHPFPLFRDESGDVDPKVLPAKLALTLTERNYIRQVARNGRLSVLTVSDCWDVPGPVDTDWLPFAQVSRRQLGPAFISADDAARYALLRLGERRDKVYGGLIVRRADGFFCATEPLPVFVEDFSPGWVRLDELVKQALFLGGSTVVARYHSRVESEVPFALSATEQSVYLNMFSTDFLWAVLNHATALVRHATGQEYLFCADGALLCYTATDSALERSLASQLSGPARRNAIDLGLQAGTLAPSAFVNRVARAGRLRVVQGSSLWGRAGKVEQWQANPPRTPARQVMADTALTPVFVQLTDVQHTLHRQAGQRRQLTFGLLFKARNAQHYVASAPVPGPEGALSLDRVMLDGLPPQGFELLGMYLCPPAQPDPPQSALLYQRFIDPQDLERARGINGPNSQGELPVYLSCADGTWLKLTPRAVGAGWGISPTPVAPSRLQFGPLFSHPDDAARHGMRHAGRFVAHEFISAILVDTHARSFIAAQPAEDRGIDSAVPQRLFLYDSSLLFPDPPVPAYPVGFQLQAAHLFFKTMGDTRGWAVGDRQLGQHFVSRDELAFYRKLLQVGGVSGAFCYLTTRQGALLKYLPRFSEREDALFTGELFFGPVDYLPSEWLSRLASDGVLQVLEQDDCWTRSGVVKVDWSLTDGKEKPHFQVVPAPVVRDEL